VTWPALLLYLIASAACSNGAAPTTFSVQAADKKPSRVDETSAGTPAITAGNLKELRIGYQKNGVLVIARQQALLETKLAPLGVHVTWVEFSSGPPLLEAMSAGGIDLGHTGDAPPIFAQVALTDDLIATQQAVADRFHRLGLIPNPVAVRDAVWLSPSM